MVKYGFVGSLDGRIAVITGAGHGLGRAYALTLAEEGAGLLVNDVDAEAGASTVAEVEDAGGQALGDTTDLSSVASGAALVERAVGEFGRVDVVVNNAGVSRPSPLEDLDDRDLDLHLGVHLRATVGTTRAALRPMREQGFGRIVNTVSGHGLEPQGPRSAAYAAAKAGVFGFTRAAALESPDGTTINAVAPLAYTRMSEGYFAGIEGAAERYSPTHVARVVVWLCGEDAAGVNGQVLRVEGERVGSYRVSSGALLPFERIGELVR